VLAIALVASAPAAADEGRVVGKTVAVSGVPAAAPTATAPAVAAPVARAAASPPVARAAAGASVAVRDFSFGPQTITVHVGDTVTWTNAGPTPHTATANDGTFNTGTLKAGQSGSHTFTTAGTFAYHCTLHPFMRGTVQVVAAATSAPPPAPAATAPAAPATAAPAPHVPAAAPTAPARPPLPRTGLDAAWLAAVGAASLALGLVLRARTRPR